MQAAKIGVLLYTKILILVFWVVITCGLLGRYQHFRGTYNIIFTALGTLLHRYTKMLPKLKFEIAKVATQCGSIKSKLHGRVTILYGLKENASTL
jgi:hypothetical protein